MKNYLSIILFLLLVSCHNDDDLIHEVTVPEEVKEFIDLTDPDEKAGQITFINNEKFQEGYVLVNDASANRVYLMDKLESEILTEWNLPAGIGNDAKILENGNLLVALMDEDPAFTFGGYAGRMAIISSDGNVLWDYEYSDENNLSHHDLEMLPNGNILFIAWERVTGEDLENLGYTGGDNELFIEKLIEISPTTNEIVWEWKSRHHLVQDQKATLTTFGVISDHPEKIDINYVDEYNEGSYNGDIMHANALEYDSENDLIYLSVNFYSEVWVIDHSTTTAEAQTGSGGHFNKGGDLVYRFGNPHAYQNNFGERIFYHNHNPTLVPNFNRILVFSNGIPAVDPHSIVYELE
ncbi:aryl-sulfate sulfotransferase [Christiangramia echinicola]|uniref:aryl-sulfate sulfotransferase n=1 Tax=Christiangramia echinicola TaxID=279359 RepID=UPI001FCAD9AF|nr:aryl-sulfate sulfotransferase [Christiangramia echinicola]